MNKNLLLFCSALLLVCSCIEKPEIQLPELEEQELSFPDGFKFKTNTELSISITDNAQWAVYEVSYTFNELTHLIGKYNSLNGKAQIDITIPTTTENLQLVRRTAKGSSTIDLDTFSAQQNLDLSDRSIANLSSRAFSSNEDCIDRLYAVESSKRGFWSINLTTGNYEETTLPLLEGGGSFACALDQSRGLMFYNVGRDLYQYDVATGSFSIANTGNPFNGNFPRLEYYNGYFWMSNGDQLYKVDGNTFETVAYYKISGFVNSNGGGDLAFDSDGTLYLACFSGLYKFTAFGEGTADIVRVSAGNFPFQLTSMAIDRQDRIFVATNDANSNLIQISKEDGSYQIVKTYDHKINDLTAWKCEANELPQQDSDNDGIIDELDDYPNDPDVAFDVYTPSALGMGTLAFEDLWPLQDDYDFNDMVVGYRFVNVMNSSNKSVRLEIELALRAIGAGDHSGFGIELPFNKSDVASVSGNAILGNQITLENNGLEAGQSKAVIIAFNDAFDHMKLVGGNQFVNTVESENTQEEATFNIVVNFVAPIDASQMSEAPFNPFIFSSYERGKEVHLSGKTPTDLVNTTYFGTADDDTNIGLNKYYQNDLNMPWGINVIHSFRYPMEKKRIDRAYNKFIDWGMSRGESYKDWYGDNSGYRNLSNIFMNN